MGGKGGFGSLLKSQRGGRKTKHFDACRDITGRRLRHAKVIDRLKEWLQKKREDDEIVSKLTEGLDRMNINNMTEINMDFVKEMKSRARQMESLVREGLMFEKQRIEEYNKRRTMQSAKQSFKYKKLFFEEDLEISDDEDEEDDSDVEDEPQSRKAGVSVTHPSGAEKEGKSDTMDPTAPPAESAEVAESGMMAAAAIQNDSTSEFDADAEDSEDENDDIDAFFDESTGDIDESRIESFFKDEAGHTNEEMIRRFVAAAARSTAMDAERLVKDLEKKSSKKE